MWGMASTEPSIRIGHGYDLHRLEPLAPDGAGRPMVLGGVSVEHAAGPVGHSDGDVVLHAVTDAILGAMGEPDIGQLFPDDDAVNAGRDSMDFLAEAVRRMRERNLEPGNLDIIDNFGREVGRCSKPRNYTGKGTSPFEPWMSPWNPVEDVSRAV